MSKLELRKAEYFLREGLVDRRALDIALRVQCQDQGPLEIILWQLGLWTLEQLADFYNRSHPEEERFA